MFSDQCSAQGCTLTHLEYHSARQRAAQIYRLRELHREAVAHARVVRHGTASDGAFEPVPRTASAVLAGDFNFKPEEPDHARLLAAMEPATLTYCDAWALAHHGRPHEPTVGLHDKEQWPGPPFTSDFVWVSADAAGRVRDVRVDESTDASDHQPLLLELAWDQASSFSPWKPNSNC